jgi:hypothetical protein
MLESSARIETTEAPDVLTMTAQPQPLNTRHSTLVTLFIARCPKCSNNGFVSFDGPLVWHHCCGKLYEREDIELPEDDIRIEVASLPPEGRAACVLRPKAREHRDHTLRPTGKCLVCGEPTSQARTNGRPPKLFCEAVAGKQKGKKVQSRCQKIAQRWHAFMRTAIRPVSLAEYGTRFDADGVRIGNWRERSGY